MKNTNNKGELFGIWIINGDNTINKYKNLTSEQQEDFYTTYSKTLGTHESYSYNEDKNEHIHIFEYGKVILYSYFV